jgi:hypothetical protein
MQKFSYLIKRIDIREGAMKSEPFPGGTHTLCNFYLTTQIYERNKCRGLDMTKMGLRITLITFFCFFIPIMGAQSSEINLSCTGQLEVAAAGDDGDIRAGIPFPSPRFSDNGNGSITDNMTGLIWLTNANCTETVGGVAKVNGTLTWADAITWSNNIASGKCGLSDGSTVGQWRLPNIVELESLINSQAYHPALSSGIPFTSGHPFSNVQLSYYWSSSSFSNDITMAWNIDIKYGNVVTNIKTSNYNVWPVRTGQ